MKILVALAAFLLVLGFNLKSVAEDAGHDAHGTAEAHPGKKPGFGANYDWSHKRHEQVTAIFPPKKRTDGANVVPAKVKLASPKFLQTVSGDTVKLEWNASEGAQWYHIQVSKDAGFNNRSMYVVEDKKLAATTLEVKGLEAGTKYFWRVAAVNGNQESMYTKSPFVFSEFEVK